MAIYRYQKINENNLTAWATNQLWFSSIHKLDDPFEMTSLLELGGFKQHPSASGLENFLKNFMETKRHTLTFCCFSKEPDIILMWALYGDGLRGVCIEYDEKLLHLDGKLLNVERQLWPVDYPADLSLPYSDIYQGSISNDLRKEDRKFISTKFIHWEYQKELRIVWENPKGSKINDASQGIPVNRESIKSVIFGERADPNKVKLIKEIFGKSMVYKIAKRSASHYKIEIVDHPSP